MITISPGHWSIGTGAVGIIDEVEEARKVVKQVSSILKKNEVKVLQIIDNKSRNQRQNLQYLISEHNKTERQLDVSVHFNSIAGQVNRSIGCEVYYVNPSIQFLAQQLAMAIANAGTLQNRGAKWRKDLAFLNKTTKPAILIEVCFVNSTVDVSLYRKNFHAICAAIASTLGRYVKSN